ncbi:MAG: DUF3634 family protein [Polyangiaceae bacterium]|jgi:hypothetical protein
MAVVVACLVAVSVGLVLLWTSARAAVTIAVAAVRDGKLEVTRGALSPRVVDGLRHVVSARPPVSSATIRVVRAKDRARVEVHGNLTETQIQQIRNIVGVLKLPEVSRGGRR